MAFLPWPEALRPTSTSAPAGSVLAGQLEHAWALACHIGDPCWEGMAARGLGLLSAAQGDHAAAGVWLTEAYTRCSRTTDRYQWVSAHVLDAVVGAALDRDDVDEGARLADALASLATRCDMRELVIRAHLPQPPRRLLRPQPPARLLAVGIDNPASRPARRPSRRRPRLGRGRVRPGPGAVPGRPAAGRGRTRTRAGRRSPGRRPTPGRG